MKLMNSKPSKSRENVAIRAFAKGFIYVNVCRRGGGDDAGAGVLDLMVFVNDARTVFSVGLPG